MEKLLLDIQHAIATSDFSSVKQLIATYENTEVLTVFEKLDNQQQAIVFRLLPKESALYVFEQLPFENQEQLIHSLIESNTLEVIRMLSSDDRVRLLDELPATVAKRILNALDATQRKEIAKMMGYPDESAGRIMSTSYLRIPQSFTVEQALDKVKRQAKDKEMVYTLYVTHDDRTLLGVCSLKDLVVADHKELVSDIMSQHVISVNTNTDQEVVANLLRKWDFYALPVVDLENRLVGIVTIDDAMDILVEETTEDMFNKVGLTELNSKEADRSKTLVHGSFTDIWRVRLPFLVVTLVGGLLAGSVIDSFEESFQAIAAVAVFIPVVMDMGGNAGTQSSTIFSRAFILGHIDAKVFIKHLLKEMLVGLSMGVFSGIAAGVIAYMWFGYVGLGFAIAIALALTMMLATSLGFLIPFILIKLGMDQAAGADPIITTIKDITGLLIYFGFVVLFMGQLF